MSILLLVAAIDGVGSTLSRLLAVHAAGTLREESEDMLTPDRVGLAETSIPFTTSLARYPARRVA